MSKQIPRGDENLFCPLHKETMDKVCHKCPLWMMIPNDEGLWQCAFVWGPLMAFQNAKEAFAVSKEVGELRNETKKAHDESATMAAIAVHRSTQTVRAVIEGNMRGIPLRDDAVLGYKDDHPSSGAGSSYGRTAIGSDDA